MTGNHACGQDVVATVAGLPVTAAELDAREAELRTSDVAAALPAEGTSEGRQLRRWLTQLLVTERLLELEAKDLDPATAPSGDELMPDVTARLELGSVTSAALTSSQPARALFAHVTARVDVTDDEITSYHDRNPQRFAPPSRDTNGWLHTSAAPSLHDVREAIAAELRQAARRRAFVTWLDARRAELVHLASGYEHPGDPRQPDNTHRH
jgi:[acyl-carrier-protein] S-malonyltransferase